ncbi:MAG: hypothetical protein ABI474_11155 [Actinomycetota bacterium]
MTTTTEPGHAPAATTVRGPLPSRRLLVALGSLYLLVFAVLITTGGDRSPEDDPTKLIAGYSVSDLTSQLMTYAAMVAAGLLIFYGAALRSLLAARTRHWTGDAAFIGFVTMAWTIASFAVTSLALHKAVGIGDIQVVQAINILDTTNFPPAMIGLMCSMVGVGITALKEATLPTWLAWASIVIGAMAPLGPGGFVPCMLFPLWLVVIAAMVRRSDT